MPDHRKSSSGFKGIFENRKIDGQCCFCISTEQEVYTCPHSPARPTGVLAAAAAGLTGERAVLAVVVTAVGWSGCMEEDGWVERYNLSQPDDA